MTPKRKTIGRLEKRWSAASDRLARASRMLAKHSRLSGPPTEKWKDRDHSLKMRVLEGADLAGHLENQLRRFDP